jgi:ABC-2 type transport system permease protein
LLRAFESELIKLRRVWMILGVIGPLLVFSVVSTIFQFQLSDRARPLLRNTGLLSPADLATPGGLARVLTVSASFGNVVVVVVFATSFASEYGWGTLRNLLVRQPNRTKLLLGKFMAVLDLVFVGRLSGVAGSMVTALVMARIKHVPTTAWFTSAGLGAIGNPVLNLMLSSIGWACLGTLAAILIRSPGAAVGAILAFPVVETVVTGWWDQGDRWLPVQLIAAVVQGGAPHTTYARALALTLGYSIIALMLSIWLFESMDVTA